MSCSDFDEVPVGRTKKPDGVGKQKHDGRRARIATNPPKSKRSVGGKGGEPSSRAGPSGGGSASGRADAVSSYVATTFRPPRPCEGCVRRKAVCNVLLSGRSGACTRCRALKRRCDVKDDAKLFVASGRQQGAEKAKLGVSTLEDVRSLGLDRSQELVLAHVTQCRQDLLELGLRMDERMGAIESRLDDMVGTQSDGEPEGAGGTDGGVSVSPGLDSEGSEIGCDRVSDYDGESEDDGGDDRVKREGDYGKLGRDYRLRESDRYDPESDYVGGEGDKVSDSEESLCDGGR